MANVVVLGAQWGDEGKGKIVDCLTENADVVARFQGGHNAGHTVVIKDTQYILHIIPSGILHADKLCLIGNGVVIEPGSLINEIEELRSYGLTVGDNLKISKNAHLIMPHHIALDQQREASKGKKKIGTTGRGIGPAYSDKIGRSGIRVVDLLSPEMFSEKLSSVLDEVNFLLSKRYKTDEIDEKKVFDDYMGYAEQIKGHIADTDVIVDDMIKAGKNILFEGAQGTLLDIDHGTYPFVTSSNATAGGACTGLGVGPNKIDAVLGVVKAYTTRVGGGPFPTEIHDDLGEKIRAKGGEYGATTGRPRRCGWLDFVALEHAVRLNGLTGLIITKLDILDELDTIKMCVAYEYNGQRIEHFPKELEVLEKCTPVYEEISGWRDDTVGATEFSSLPEKAVQYIRLIEERLGVKVDLISTGQKRDQLIRIREAF
ncbi:MAG: adenylosuccinate synthase [Nitrospirota bacterium]|nr:MAG: adenylosuccinate synthase [Nitrospirota bacterium]